ncbi:ribosomal protein L7/L12 [Proteobacteria bacterium 005FR1]|nr:ribosomal protein L7/L12 [Proteobacteria bacterium 005FR1]
MTAAVYEVVYIDKFGSEPDADLRRERIGRRFRLSRAALERLSSGAPIVVKKKVTLEEADRYAAAIEAVGGVCWVQAVDADGGHYERRQTQRRQTLDRRTQYRGSSIQPDRRGSCGRRSTDVPDISSPRIDFKFT